MAGIYNRYGGMNVQSPFAWLPTYYVSGTGYAAYATPTDMLTITCGTGKIVRILNMKLNTHTTAGALQSVFFIKRTTANSGGTASTPTIHPVDTNDPEATSVVRLYSVIPASLGTATFTHISQVVTTVPTAVPALSQVATMAPSVTTQTYYKGPILRAGESLCMNYNGAALPAGFTASWDILFTESDE